MRFKNLFSDGSLSVNRKAVYKSVYKSSILKFCWIRLLVLIVLGCGFWGFLYKVSSLLQKQQFYFFLFNLDVFSFFFFSTVTRTSNTMLNRIGESRHPCLVPEFREKAFSFSPLNTMLAVGLSQMAFIMLRYSNPLQIFLPGQRSLEVYSPWRYKKSDTTQWLNNNNNFPFIFTFWSFYRGCWILSNAFSVSIEMIMWFLFFLLLMWYMCV